MGEITRKHRGKLHATGYKTVFEGAFWMETPYDWLTVMTFAGLIVLFLQRSQGEPRDHLWQYLIAALGCAFTNYIGNEAMKSGEMLLHAGAIALFGATIAFIWRVLQPFGQN